MHVIVVEDDEGVAGALLDVLGRARHTVTWCARGSEVLTRHREADVVLLDLGLPDADGLDVLRKIRAVSSVPVLVVTARDDERSTVRALHNGADDYLVKPVRMAELLARIEAVERRARAGTASRSPVESLDARIDLQARTVSIAGRPVTLTRMEFDVLAAIASRRGVAVSREQILDEVWGDAYLAISRSLDVHIAQIRAKLARPGLLVTVRGYGYRLGG